MMRPVVLLLAWMREGESGRLIVGVRLDGFLGGEKEEVEGEF